MLRVGLFSVGLHSYWDQFPGLLPRLNEYVDRVAHRLQRNDIEVINLGMIDTPEKASEAGHAFRRADVDLIFLYVTTYALSSTVLPVVRRAKVPVIVLNLSPGEALDYSSFNALQDRQKMTGEWLAWCQSCPVPEIANVFHRCSVPFRQITGLLENDTIAWKEIQEWLDAAQVVRTMEHNRLGLMGHYYGGMLDVYTDLTLQCATFGGHIEMIEVNELTSLCGEVSVVEVEGRVAQFREAFDVQADCSADELACAAKTSVALDRLVARHRLGSLAYYYSGDEAVIPSIILGTSLLTARGIPVAGEYEVKNAQAMKIMDAFGAGGSFTEFYATDFKDDVILMGHDGPGHLAIAEGKIRVRPLKVYHGKMGRGLSVEMSVKHGPVTLLSVVENAGSLKLLTAQAESVPGPILEIGNTNSRYRFPLSARDFIEAWNSQGPAHHCAIGIGHIGSKIQKFSDLLGITTIQIC